MSERAAVLHGARDLRVEQVEPEPLRPGAVRVAVRATGLCGSDLHYYADGRNGSNVLRSPTVLGHEASGVVVELGEGVDAGLLGASVAVEPARPCRRCPTCAAGRYNLCPSGRCFGSPPVHGTIRGTLVVDAELVHRVPPGTDPAVAALVEPLAVACWAVRRAGVVSGASVLVTGAGPIGQLAVAAARAAGAARIVLTDVDRRRLDLAAGAGADEVLDTGTVHPEPGAFDQQLECSGAPEAVRLDALVPGAVVALVGIPANRPAAPDLLAAAQRWEIDVRGCFRYGPGAFAAAAALLRSGRADLERMVTARFPLAEADRALRTALTERDHLKIAVLAEETP
ncbi:MULTISPECIES: alcohol dehydrogenase catalytic domain-containing protein [unclassified Saccharopolyspora]|uniref:alcohol dehydrogenase catalytic domain-containing protein n=1 Tax=unclassified Saccharopolyspora TaxID=2646250 RepID=UPI001CD4D7E1|nr:MULTISPECIES: alcohol dehydrogenase catalytic domain-containing protein [unclassified Saccharopolyspora]MCA1187192.1 alcohol dehydrogenase catalytic domain-containing protein [Saccharopolyspora sp. 6T]MCA1194314.1 alcohol dehydrogenase catalytic domain-containing protein [Saccharopolyspora sp. 6V]MCA1229752.1 alcohol dehydrogenase catalytic domain-containing protein [Saccharopolyspora sp. 6M]